MNQVRFPEKTAQTTLNVGTHKANSGGTGTINFFDKNKADELAKMGFKYVEHKINANQIIYAFIDTPKLREKLVGQYDKHEYYVSKNVYL